MNDINKIIEHIVSESDAQCADIERIVTDECRTIKEQYSRIEQEEYWKFIDAGSKEAEQRVIKLKNLAEAEAEKQIQATREEMINAAFLLAVRKLEQLPRDEYASLLSRLKLEPGFSAAEIIARYRNLLTPSVKSTLFD